jgi:hypothetical protein
MDEKYSKVYSSRYIPQRRYIETKHERIETENNLFMYGILAENI